MEKYPYFSVVRIKRAVRINVADKCFICINTQLKATERDFKLKKPCTHLNGSTSHTKIYVYSLVSFKSAKLIICIVRDLN